MNLSGGHARASCFSVTLGHGVIDHLRGLHQPAVGSSRPRISFNVSFVGGQAIVALPQRGWRSVRRLVGDLVPFAAMRVLLVTNDYPPKAGGIQQYLGNFVAECLDDVLVLAPADPKAEPTLGVVRHERTFMWPTKSVQSWVAGHVAQFAPDLVLYAAPYPLAHMGPRLRATTGVPFAVMTYGAEAIIPLTVPGLRGLVARPMREADVLFSLSEYTATKVAAVAGRDPVVLGAGIDLDLFSPADSPPDPFVVGCISRFVPRKGHAKVLRAIAELRQRGHDVSALMVGTGRLEASLRKLAQQLDVPTTFATDVAWSELPGLYRSISVFAMPAVSRWWGLEAEGLGMVYLEASASGLPVIAGPSGGAPETITAETGVVAATVDELVQTLRPFLEDPSLARQMGKAGRDFVAKEYTWNRVRDRFVEATERINRL